MAGWAGEVALAVQRAVILAHLLLVLHAHPVTGGHVRKLADKHDVGDAVAGCGGDLIARHDLRRDHIGR